jgi:Ribosomal S13/S15 N-terminal domain
VTHIKAKLTEVKFQKSAFPTTNLRFYYDIAIMGRLHSKGKGISASTIPYSRSVPTWFKSTPEQVVDNICKLAKKGATPSQIGVVLRDSHGVAQVKVVTGMVFVICGGSL